MRVVLQRVNRACVAVDGEIVGSIQRGLLLLVGVAQGDTENDARRLAQKCAEMRIFSDEAGRFNLSLARHRRRGPGREPVHAAGGHAPRSPAQLCEPAAAPEVAERLIEAFSAALLDAGVAVQTGRFGAKMDVELVNDGPVTIVIDSAELDRPRSR